MNPSDCAPLLKMDAPVPRLGNGHPFAGRRRGSLGRSRDRRAPRGPSCQPKRDSPQGGKQRTIQGSQLWQGKPGGGHNTVGYRPGANAMPCAMPGRGGAGGWDKRLGLGPVRPVGPTRKHDFSPLGVVDPRPRARAGHTQAAPHRRARAQAPRSSVVFTDGSISDSAHV